jgi:hypothetical protein
MRMRNEKEWPSLRSDFSLTATELMPLKHRNHWNWKIKIKVSVPEGCSCPFCLGSVFLFFSDTIQNLVCAVVVSFQHLLQTVDCLLEQTGGH